MHTLRIYSGMTGTASLRLTLLLAPFGTLEEIAEKADTFFAEMEPAQEENSQDEPEDTA
jgi:hypothetical protein